MLLFHLLEGVGFEPTKALCRQIYSLLPLASRASLHYNTCSASAIANLLLPNSSAATPPLLPPPPPPWAGGGTRTRDLLITNQLLYQLSYTGKASGLPKTAETRSIHRQRPSVKCCLHEFPSDTPSSAPTFSPSRWRNNSYNTIPVETEALREEICPTIGIFT